MPEGQEISLDLATTIPESKVETQVQLTPEKQVAPKVFEGSVFSSKLEARKAEGLFTAVVITDIDNTFKMRESTPETDQATDLITTTAKESNVPLVAVTGNSIDVVKARIASGELPQFDAIAGSVGTELYVLKYDAGGNPQYELDQEFENLLLQKGFNRKDVALLAEGYLIDANAKHDRWKMEYQKPEEENAYLARVKGQMGDQEAGEEPKVEPHKLSFYAMAETSQDRDAMLEETQKRFPNQTIVIAEEIGYNSKLTLGQPKKFCIDILPMGKDGAANYIKDRNGIDYSVVAGDSGNDSDLLTRAGDVAIVVGGAKPELVEAVTEATKKADGRLSFKKERDKEGKIVRLTYMGSEEGPRAIVRAINIIDRASKRRLGLKIPKQEEAESTTAAK